LVAIDDAPRKFNFLPHYERNEDSWLKNGLFAYEKSVCRRKPRPVRKKPLYVMFLPHAVSQAGFAIEAVAPRAGKPTAHRGQDAKNPASRSSRDLNGANGFPKKTIRR